MDMQISLSFETPQKPVRSIDDMPIYPMGHGVSLEAEFINTGADDLNIQDPQTSVHTFVWFQPEETGAEIIETSTPSQFLEGLQAFLEKL